jgi:hypothetical protein
MDWMTTKEASELWGISTRRIQILCDNGKVEGAQRLGNIWVIPKGMAKPIDGRTKNGRVQKAEMADIYGQVKENPENTVK